MDQNLSFKLGKMLNDIFPDIVHVRDLGLQKENDQNLWEIARNKSFVIVTKDSDFNERAVIKGFPPKIIWIKRGDCSTKEVEVLIRNKYLEIQNFIKDSTNSILVLI